MIAEFGNIVWKKVRRGELTMSEGEEIIEAFLTAAPVALYPSLRYLRGALDIAVQFQRSAYDALYLALAVAEGCQVITADEQLERGLQDTRLGPFVLSLANM